MDENDTPTALKGCGVSMQFGDNFVIPVFLASRIDSKYSFDEIFQVLESMVKNCGSLIHEQIATKEFMEYFKDTLQVNRNFMCSKRCNLENLFKTV